MFLDEISVAVKLVEDSTDTKLNWCLMYLRRIYYMKYIYGIYIMGKVI